MLRNQSRTTTDRSERRLGVLHSFPHRLGMGRICTTAWYEIDSVTAAGANMLVIAGDSVRPFAQPVVVKKSLSRGRLRIPYRLVGTLRACDWHDRIVARALPRLVGQVDIIHAWPLAARHTIRVAKRLGIPVALERCNAHTRFAYSVVQEECERLGVMLPKDHEHSFNEEILSREEEEYENADGILCPSDFVRKTFIDEGYERRRLIRFFYGVDEAQYFPDPNRHVPTSDGLTMIFVGVCAVRKGLHFALEAWLRSPASETGKFLIAGDFVPAYQAKLAGYLKHPSVRVLGHRTDVPALLRQCDLLTLPSIEEGFGLVCTEAMASGCVPLVSDACTELCQHMKNAMVHKAGDVQALTDHITALHNDRGLLASLKSDGLRATPSVNWCAAGRSLLSAYEEIVSHTNSGRLGVHVEASGGA